MSVWPLKSQLGWLHSLSSLWLFFFLGFNGWLLSYLGRNGHLAKLTSVKYARHSTVSKVSKAHDNGVWSMTPCSWEFLLFACFTLRGKWQRDTRNNAHWLCQNLRSDHESMMSKILGD